MKHLERSRSALPTTVALFALATCAGLGATSGCADESESTCVDASCAEEDPSIRAGGETSVADAGPRAFTHPASNLDMEAKRKFALGDHLFNRGWVTAPASAEGNDGLGPTYVATSCSSCHFKDGRSGPAGEGTDPTPDVLVRISVPGEVPGTWVPDPVYGDQLQPLGVLGVPGEGTIELTWAEQAGAFADGASFSLRVPTFSLVDLAFGPLPEGAAFSPRVAPAMIGLGLLAAIPEATILALSDPDDRDGDGVRGVPNYVTDAATGARVLGRFGWKANQPHLDQQVSGALRGDMGLSTALFPDQNCPEAQTECASAPDGGDPEVDAQKVDPMVFYCHTLAVPERRDADAEAVRRGAKLFEEVGCASCHVPRHETGDLPGYPWLSGQTIWPYTDLLVHDMGEGLADGRPDGEANGNQWRTAPLWGLGLYEVVGGHDLLLHDGRARGVAEAILWHGGEGEASKEAFRALDASSRDALVAFVRSL